MGSSRELASRPMISSPASPKPTTRPEIPCSPSAPCGSMDVALGTGSFAGDLVVTVQLSGSGHSFQFNRMGFNSNITSGFVLDCFNFGVGCTSGVGAASLQGAKQEANFGRFQNTLYTGLNGGSGCGLDGTGCKNLFTFVIGNSNGPLQLTDFNPYVAGSSCQRSVQRIHCYTDTLTGQCGKTRRVSKRVACVEGRLDSRRRLSLFGPRVSAKNRNCEERDIRNYKRAPVSRITT